ncbi:MAG: hypothetical protein HYX27_07710 [Acidobacteria bacterium]|nr:hypothetical protein [Acidobacteriota bacterium]
MRIYKRFAQAAAALLFAAVVYSQREAPPPVGGPLPGLSASDAALFEAGKEDFLEVETPEDGLGPAFNGRSCAECHSVPAVGGIGNQSVTRAGSVVNGQYVEPAGGSLIHKFSKPDHRCQPVVPRNATVVATRIPIAIFGDGLIEAIPDAAIQELADNAKPDGIRGRAAMVIDPASGERRVGRFGWKAQQATLLGFAGDAYLFEMGITNDLFPSEVASGLTADQLAACDGVADPEDKRDPVTGRRSIDNFANFMRFLAPPPRLPGTPETARGEQLFQSAGCAICHRPVIQTGPSEIRALDRRPVVLYSDLLLHDIGTGDGIAQGAAGPNEMRTAPLWGLHLRKQLLHDGSALNPEQAIERHAGEASPVRDRFHDLQPRDRQALIRFLETI